MLITCNYILQLKAYSSNKRSDPAILLLQNAIGAFIIFLFHLRFVVDKEDV